jgi:serine/threonine protein kinase
VIGAYRWLPEHGIGLATELPEAAAFAAVRPLRLAVFGLLALVSLGAVLVVAASVAVQLLRQRVEQVRQLGQYTLERKLGQGGVGEVYLARHALLHRPTAVKLIRPHLVSEQSLARFEREVQLTSELTSPNTVEIYDFGCTQEGVFYYAMEYLPGLDLGHLLELQGTLPPSRAVHILRQLCATLAEAQGGGAPPPHARGLIHRDIKPANVILTERGGQFDFVKVLDFGLVKDVSTPTSDEAQPARELAGTLPYIAPERIDDPECQDPRSDLFSVGVLAFNLLTGRQPFEGSSPSEIAYHVGHTPALRASGCAPEAIPPALDELVANCLATDPDERPRTAETIIARLDALTLPDPWDQRAAQRWWAANVKRLGTAGHELGLKAAGSTGVERGSVVQAVTN